MGLEEAFLFIVLCYDLARSLSRVGLMHNESSGPIRQDHSNKDEVSERRTATPGQPHKLQNMDPTGSTCCNLGSTFCLFNLLICCPVFTRVCKCFFFKYTDFACAIFQIPAFPA